MKQCSKHTTLITVSIAASLAVNVFANAQNTPEQKDPAFLQRECSMTLMEPSWQLMRVKKRHLNIDSSNNNLKGTRLDLEKRLNDYQASINNIVAKYSQQGISSESEYKNALQLAKAELQSIQTTTGEKLVSDFSLLRAKINEFDIDLQEMDAVLPLLKEENCSALAKERISLLKGLQSKMKAYHADTEAFRVSKADALFFAQTNTEAVVRAKLIQAFSNTVQKSYAEMETIISGAFGMFEIQDEIAKWYHEAYVKHGPGRENWSKYFLINESIAQIDSDLKATAIFQAKLDALPLDSSLKAAAQAQINSAKIALETSKNKFQATGFLERTSWHNRVVLKMKNDNIVFKDSFCSRSKTKYRKIVKALETKNEPTLFFAAEPILKDFLGVCYYPYIAKIKK